MAISRKRLILNRPKTSVIRAHFIDKVGRGLRAHKHFRPSVIAEELSHVRCTTSKEPRITTANVRGFFSYLRIDPKNICPGDIKKAQVLPRGGATEKTGLRRERGKSNETPAVVRERTRISTRKYFDMKRERTLYKLGVFKPREFNLASALKVCCRKINRNVSAQDIEWAKRVLQILSKTEDKAMRKSDVEAKLRKDPAFSGRKIWRTITHLRAHGIVNTSIRDWLVVSEKFASVNQRFLELKLGMLKIKPKMDYMGGIIGRDHRGIIPPTINPDGLHVLEISTKAKNMERELVRSPLGRLVLENLDRFPLHLLQE